MNKYNVILTIAMLVNIAPIAAIRPLTAQEEQLRIDYIGRLSKANVLSISQYIENGAFSYELIERDIELFKNDSQQALNKKSWAEGYFYSWMLPGSLKLIAVGSGVSALAAGVATTVGSVLFNDVWNSSYAANHAGRIYSKMLKVSGADFADRMEARVNYWDAKARYLSDYSDYNRAVLSGAPALPFTFVATLISAGLCKYSSGKLSQYKSSNAAFIEQMQERYNNDLVVIAQLQDIAYKAPLK